MHMPVLPIPVSCMTSCSPVLKSTLPNLSLVQVAGPISSSAVTHHGLPSPSAATISVALFLSCQGSVDYLVSGQADTGVLITWSVVRQIRGKLLSCQPRSQLFKTEETCSMRHFDQQAPHCGEEALQADRFCKRVVAGDA